MLKLAEALPNANLTLLHQMADPQMRAVAQKGGGGDSSAMGAQQDGRASSSAMEAQQGGVLFRGMRGNTLADTATTWEETATGETVGMGGLTPIKGTPTIKCIREGHIPFTQTVHVEKLPLR